MAIYQSIIFHVDHAIVELRLNKNSLTGSIPSEIGLPTALSESFLVDPRCRLYPQTHHFNSATLVLYNNKLKSTIPSEVGHLTALREYDCVIWLYANTSQKVFSHAKAAFLVIVETLSIFLNELTGKIPSEIGRLVEMGELY